MRVAVAALLSLAVVVASAAPAAAHVGLVPGTLAPGETVEAQVVLAHGCGEDGTVPGHGDDSSPTRAVTLAPTEGLAITPLESDGWSLEQGDAGTRWTSEDDDGVEDVVFLDVEVDAGSLDDGEELWVPVTQECVDGTVMAWDHPGAAQEASDLPAMLVRVATPASAPAGEAGGLPTPVLIGLVVSMAIALGAGVTVISMRRT
jgi:periplasmic copper chaperone A